MARRNIGQGVLSYTMGGLRHSSTPMRATPAAAAAPTDLELRDELARVHSQAYAWAVRCCREDRGEAEDVLHEAYMKVLDGRARFEGRSSFKTWLLGVVRHTAHEHARRSWRRLMRLERWWKEREDAGSDMPGDEGRVGELTTALSRLSKRQQEVLHLVFYQNLTINEAAEVLAMPVGTARTHYERGKSRLRQLLDHPGNR
jgi:RNA polymerase sigma factor (sigma-70 family)